MPSYSYNFVSGDTVTPTKLNSARTISDIVNADIKSDAAIALSKLATGALPAAITVATSNIVDANVTNSKLASDLDASKLTTGTLPIARIADGAVTAAKLDGAQAGSAPIYGCRAWVNFDGRDANATTVSGERRCNIRGSGNVTKVVRTAGGNYNIHITTALPDANYAVSVTAWNSNSQMFINGGSVHTVTPTSSLFRVRTAVGTEALTGDTTGADTDAAHVFVLVFR